MVQIAVLLWSVCSSGLGERNRTFPHFQFWEFLRIGRGVGDIYHLRLVDLQDEEKGRHPIEGASSGHLLAYILFFWTTPQNGLSKGKC